MGEPPNAAADMSEEAAALCDWLSEFDWDFERAAASRNLEPRLVYRRWLESLGWNQSLAARLYRRKGSDNPVSRQAIEGQMKRFGVVRPPDFRRELEGQDLEGALHAMRDVCQIILEKSSAERLCCEQLLELAETYKALNLDSEARAAILSAATLAERSKEIDLIARALRALPYNLVQVNAVGRSDTAMVSMLQGWLPLLREYGDPEALAYCLAYLGYEHHASGKRGGWDLFRSLTREAMEFAFQSGSPETIDVVTSIRVFALSAPDHIDDRIALLEEMERKLPKARADRKYWTLNLLISDLLEVGRIADAYVRTPQLRELEDQVSVPWVSRYRASLAVLRGEWAEVEYLAQSVAHAPTASAVQIRGLHQIEVLRHRGEWDDLETLARWNMNQTPKNTNARIRLAGVMCLLGRHEEARQDFMLWARDGFAKVPSDFTQIDTLCGLAEICHALGKEEEAVILYDLLDPYRARVNLIRVTAIVRGSVARYLGMLAHTAKEWDRAIADFELALETNEKLEAWPYLAWTRFEYACLLVDADRDTSRAEELARLASSTAAELGMPWLGERSDALLLRLA
ncbi:MAG: tetratricopeptide (TPR) repeat protein [Myxococcota bacterium]|jgi:tetratricopeptide (TPR) repeat protein